MADPSSPEFQRAFVAISYVAGQRNDALLAALPVVSEEARSFARRLEHPARERRAEVLARELGRVAVALDARKVA